MNYCAINICICAVTIVTIGWTHVIAASPVPHSPPSTPSEVLDALNDFEALTHVSVIKSGMVCRYLKVKLPFKK